MKELATLLIDSGSTLIVRSCGYTRCYRRRGVADLLDLLDNSPEILRDATVADKIIGKAAAGLMALGRVKHVFTPKITQGALDILINNDIGVTYRTIVPMVENRTHTGRCPLDTACASLTDPHDIHINVKKTLQNLNK